MKSLDIRPVMPWWRIPAVWLVVGGPATVVVAGIATAVIAVRGADPVVAPSAIPRAVTQLVVDTPTPAPPRPQAPAHEPEARP